jgi:hypothetical protein
MQSPINVKASLIDFAIQHKGLVTDGEQWAELNELLDVWTSKNNNIVETSGRKYLSSTIEGYCKGDNVGMVKKITYSNETMEEIGELQTNGQVSSLSKSSTKGYWLSDINYNFEHDYLSNTFRQIYNFTESAGGSVTSMTDINGYVISSASNTSSVFKLNFTTLSVSRSTDTINKNGASSVEF